MRSDKKLEKVAAILIPPLERHPSPVGGSDMIVSGQASHDLMGALIDLQRARDGLEDGSWLKNLGKDNIADAMLRVLSPCVSTVHRVMEQLQEAEKLLEPHAKGQNPRDLG